MPQALGCWDSDYMISRMSGVEIGHQIRNRAKARQAFGGFFHGGKRGFVRMLLADEFLQFHEHFPRDECGCGFAVLTDYRLVCDDYHVGKLSGFDRLVAFKLFTLGGAVRVYFLPSARRGEGD